MGIKIAIIKTTGLVSEVLILLTGSLVVYDAESVTGSCTF
jgi:hypothetical protein